MRRLLILTGVVQGVGFRPNVARLAEHRAVTGLCGNDDNSVFVEAQGELSEVEAFFCDVRTDLPPLATIITWGATDLATVPDEQGFHIVPSRRAVGAITLIPADAAVCPDCLADMADPANRRFRYPFTTCTNCGPRLTIIRDVPYDRPLTTMAEFPMCEACRSEYEDPHDRRYHAQPISCFDCGPTLWLEPVGTVSPGPSTDSPVAECRVMSTSTSVFQPKPVHNPTLSEREESKNNNPSPESTRDPSSGECLVMSTSTGVSQPKPVHNLTLGDGEEVFGNGDSSSGGDRRERFGEVIAEAVRRLRLGEILAVKGIGGFTLMCDARNQAAVTTLRERKRRPGKPLAVMAGSVDAARRVAELSQEQVQVLTGREAPIVLAPMAPTYDLAEAVAPGLDDVGVMLAYAPLHRLLFTAGYLDPNTILVATSANSSSHPLTWQNEDARTDLSHIVDAFLMHDRGIHVPVEDSVVMADGDQVSPIRRSRGYAPLPVFIGGPDRPVLAVGAELKNTFALTRDGMAFLSAHIGDMGTLETQRAFERSVQQLLTAHRRTPELIVCDKHPGYATHAWAHREGQRLGVPVVAIQHHHAHALSLLAENRDLDKLTCVVLDGTGYGDDATIWGGEILRLDPGLGFERLWHLPGFWLPGGDSAVRHPWKSAVGLASEYGIDLTGLPAYAELTNNPSQFGIDEWALVKSQLSNQVGVVRTTSTGRVFDAAASWLGVRQSVTYEAQAAMELEALARRCPHQHSNTVADMEALVHLMVEGVRLRRPIPCLARLFHSTLAALIAQAIYSVEDEGVAIGLTGGVFANRLLTGYLADDLATHGRRVVRHRIVPANDGGLALGQALAGVLFDGKVN